MLKMMMSGFLIACFAGCALAQTDTYPKNEFFAGYSYNNADINTLTVDPGRLGQHGVNLQYVRNVNEHLGVVGDISAHFHRDTRSTSTGTFKSQRDQYFALGGIQLKARSESRVQPFVHALVRGFAVPRLHFGH